MKYDEHFKEHYTKRLKGCSAKRLVDFEQNLTDLIDSDLIENCLLCDEILVLYNLVRDECVYRVAKISEEPI